MQQLDEAGHCLTDGLLITPAEVLPEAVVALRVVTIAPLAKFAKDLCEVVCDEAEVVSVSRVRRSMFS
jgi:hypothetical protein